MGIQTFNRKEFKALGRGHDYEEIEKAISFIQNSNVDSLNVSTDLMIGIPEQTLKTYKESLDKLVRLNFGHCSLYMLTLEKGTPFHIKFNQNPELLPSEDEVADMYEET